VFYRGRVKPVAPATDVVQGPLAQPIRLTPRYETQFFSHAGFWYPGPPEEDYFQARLTLVVPPEYECVAGGEMVARGRRDATDDVVSIEKAGNSIYTFASRAPVKYMAFIVGKFDRKRERPGPVPVSTYVSTEVLDSRPGIIDEAVAILDFYGRAFGPYPYEKLGIVLRLWSSLGGNSPASFLVLNEVPWMGDTGFPTPVNTPVDLSSWEEYLMAHEIAHQWWGQGVSFESFKDQWLSEGLAQFAAASYLRHRYGEPAFAAILKKFTRWTMKKSFRGPVVMGSRLSHLDFVAYQAIVYDKAALALFMLQDLIGREAFEAGLRAFFEKHKFQAARTGEFIAAMESASGRDLKEFFQGWFSSWELPEVRTSWTETAVPDGFRLDLRVTQLKGRFVFPLWIEWSRGAETGRTMVVVDEAVEEASVVLPVRPEKVRVNPDRAVPGKFLF
jgi:aminopeptidase N